MLINVHFHFYERHLQVVILALIKVKTDMLKLNARVLIKI